MSFHGFDTAQIRSMAAHMKSVGPSARTLHGKVAGLLLEVQGLMDGKPATTSPRLEPLLGQVFPLFYSGLPASLQPELDDTSASMDRRCKQLDAVRTLEKQGYTVDPSLYFDDEPPPDEQKIKDALKYFDDHIGDSGGFLWSDSAQGGKEVLDDFAKLSPAELDAVMSRMSDSQLKKLNGQLGEGSSWWGAGDSDGAVKARWENMLQKECGPTTLARIEPALSNLKWQPDTTVDGAHYQAVDDPLFGPNGPDLMNDLRQGQDGDCWFLSSLAAITERDPNWPQEHIKQNANGTYTVTFYQKGPLPGMPPTPVEVTVDNKLPVDSNGHPVYADTRSGATWVAIYEKAFAQYSGGYKKIEGGWGDVGMSDLTGQPATRHSPGDVSFADISTRIGKGEAVTIGTKGDGDVHDDRLVSGHEYSVERVDMNAHPPTITLLNPWGSGQYEGTRQMPQEVTLTEDQYRKNLNEVSFTPSGV
ncbi:C2 family cysteine protease [Streptomyces sp. NPDC088194]|uniref:C2 family cysteine protease n=1 Tax=Streptomyces sp. NPDC088194 TaxID=3154931 RepID=UPI00344EBB57